MWRLANYIYRAFRNVATYRCPQDIIVPITTVSTKDDQSNREEKQENFKKCLFNIHHIIKTNQFSSKNFEKLQEYLHKISHQQVSKQKSNVIKSIEPPKIECIVQEIPSPPTPPIQQEETLDSLLQSDEIYMSTLKSLSELNEETMSIINNQLAIEAIEAGDVQSGIETLQTSAKDGKNAAALYNLGICYERGIGVKQDRAKACDYYRQAASLGHINAQFNLTLLSNHIDIHDNEDEKIEQTITNKPPAFRLSFTKEYKEEQKLSWNDYHFNLTKTLSCLS